MPKKECYKPRSRGIICEKPLARSSRRSLPSVKPRKWLTLLALQNDQHFGLTAHKNDAAVRVVISPALLELGYEEYGVIATRLIKKGEVITT